MYDNLSVEVDEAVMAGERALKSLREAKKELDSARKWGIWDLVGGGALSSFIKHGKMDKAKSYMQQAKCDLDAFSKELNDVNMMVNLDIDMSEFLTFADIFFDGVLADWLVQDKINDARNNVIHAISLVENAINRLRRY